MDVLHIPHAAIRRVDYRRSIDGSQTVQFEAEALPARAWGSEVLSLEFNAEAVNQHVWDQLFGGGAAPRPYHGITIQNSVPVRSWETIERDCWAAYGQAAAEIDRAWCEIERAWRRSCLS